MYQLFFQSDSQRILRYLEHKPSLINKGIGPDFNLNPPATTITIAKIHHGQLESLNIGNSGLIVIRDKGIVHQSVEQKEGKSNTSSVTIQKEEKYPNYTTKITAPYISDTFALKENDIVLLHTDGLTNNLSPDRIVQIINDNAERPVTEIVKTLVDQAVTASNGDRDQGFRGKKDDISLLMYIHKD